MGAGFFKASYFHDLSTVDVPASLDAEIRQEIAKTPVVVYSKDYCPYCTRAKTLLDKIGVTCKVVEINQMEGDTGLQIQATLYKMTSQKTVPNIFVGGNSIGGNSELQALYQAGKLANMLDDAKVAHTIMASSS